VPVALFVNVLKDQNPRVRLIAAWGLGRLGRGDASGAIVPLTVDPDPLVAHVAVNALVNSTPRARASPRSVRR
jgi:HEAT repeat protein